MRKILFVLMAFAATVVNAQEWRKTSHGIALTTQGMEMELCFYSPSIVRVYKSPIGEHANRESVVVTAAPKNTNVSVEKNGDNLAISTHELSVIVNAKTGGIVFNDTKGHQLLVDKDYGTSFAPKDDAGKPSYQVRNAFRLGAEEPIYGLGQIQDGKLNRRNSVHHLQNENTKVCSPSFISPVKGYAVYWDNYSISDYSDSPQELSFTSLGNSVDYYFMYGHTVDGVISQVRYLTGKVPMLPLWAYGYFQSKDRYHSQDESIDVLRRYRQLHVPIDVVVQDWEYWPKYHDTDKLWNSQTFDTNRFPNPEQWAREIHSLHGKLMISCWPGFGPETDQYKELRSKGMLLGFCTFPPAANPRPYDVFHPVARDIYWKYASKLYDRLGLDGWWLDSSEPDHMITSIWQNKDKDFDLPTHLGSYRSVKNLYSLLHSKGIYEHQRQHGEGKRVFILTRSGFIGQQKYGSVIWSGDVTSTWDALEKQIPAALNLSMMGMPNWTSDIGGYIGAGFSKDGARDPRFQELYVRWMQMGTFCPIMRSHGKRIPREIWQFGERGTWCFDAIEKMIQLRYRLLPYNYSTSWQVSHNNDTFMRALVMDFPHDTATYHLGGEYMFGKAFLVAPVTKAGVDTWQVYLPKATQWWNFWTYESFEGGQNIQCKVTKDEFPLYVKAGSIVPFGPQVEYTSQKKWDNLEIRVYPGADGDFTLYEDDTDNYSYEGGKYSTIDFHWDNTSCTLTIAPRKGNFSGMLKKRKFCIRIIGKKDCKTVNYKGNQVIMKL